MIRLVIQPLERVRVIQGSPAVDFYDTSLFRTKDDSNGTRVNRNYRRTEVRRLDVADQYAVRAANKGEFPCRCGSGPF